MLMLKKGGLLLAEHFMTLSMQPITFTAGRKWSFHILNPSLVTILGACWRFDKLDVQLIAVHKHTLWSKMNDEKDNGFYWCGFFIFSLSEHFFEFFKFFLQFNFKIRTVGLGSK